ncbi:MAG: hypothetical protein NTV34_02315 [Proteobacteria bacterium]|nr:hypothetical protein [Pseudomonadota bacterium]
MSLSAYLPRDSARRLVQSADTSENFLVGLALATGHVTFVSFVYGFAVFFVGVALSLWCAGHLRPGKAEGGGVSGPWRFVRHPETIARFLIVFGIILITRTAWIFGAAVVVLGLQYRHLVKTGDSELARWLGPNFAAYRLFVPSLLPQFIPARLPQSSMRASPSEHPWSFRKTWSRRSLIAAIAGLAGILVWLYLGLLGDASIWWFRVVGVLPLMRGFWLLKAQVVSGVVKKNILS